MLNLQLCNSYGNLVINIIHRDAMLRQVKNNVALILKQPFTVLSKICQSSGIRIACNTSAVNLGYSV